MRSPDLIGAQALVSHVEFVCDLSPGRAGNRGYGIRASDWFLPVGLATRLLGPFALPIARLSATEAAFARTSKIRPSSLVRGLARPRLSKWSVSADALSVNNNIRAFYFAEGLTFKAGRTSPGVTTTLEFEIEIRRSLRPAGFMRVPPVVLEGVTEIAAFLGEKIISADAASPAIAPRRLASGLFDFYFANGARLRNLSEVIDRASFATQAGAAFSSCGSEAMGLAATACAAAIFALADRGKSRIFWGLCHGDLSPGNLIAAGDIIYLIDWEWAHPDIVFSDFWKLFLKVRGFEDAIRAKAEELFAGEDILPVREQILLGNLAFIIHAWRKLSAIGLRPEEQQRKLRYLIEAMPLAQALRSAT